MSMLGSPCWYEIATPDQAATQAFYGPLLGWTFQDAGMAGFSYGLAMAGGDMVAGLMQPDAPMPCFWMIYFAADDIDATARRVSDLGGKVFRAPEDIPGTGRFAILIDPQGAPFGLLQPLEGQKGNAFDQAKQGHGNWNELNSTDPVAALAFYRDLFGWQASTAMPMGETGDYQLFAHQGRDIGAMMPLQKPGTPSHWLPYFGVPSATATIAKTTELGGTIHYGPSEVPGGAFIAMGQDPQGAAFAVVGGK
ncbi:VOC family protein [Gemmobacter serpentinus]|uniref:VOC family protein n=1 Tax=Gemmobacter serpentinus TaxID=2652247 RepID=UPI00124BE93E|nr:VOC family protein [Gemmobacter serpentinus]